MALRKIWVKAGPAAGNRVALCERHAEHPSGEVYVAGKKAVQVARTPAVDAKLHEQVLVEVDPKTLKKDADGGGAGAPTGGAGGNAGAEGANGSNGGAGS